MKIHNVYKIEGEMLVEGFFEGVYTKSIETVPNSRYVVALSDLNLGSLRENLHKIGALIATTADITRHTTILARELGVPIILCQSELPLLEGQIYTIGYSEISKNLLPSLAKTSDGVTIKLRVSVTNREGILKALENKLEIGLFRTEFLGEDARELYSLASSTPFSAIRLFDYEGDKNCLSTAFDLEHQKNVQIVNIVETTNCKSGILLPNVDTSRQIQEYRMYIRHLAAKKAPPLGAMLETQSAIKNYISIMRNVDFCCVGINSLLRMGYTTRQIKSLCTKFAVHADKMHLPLSACGELNDALVKALVRSGIKTLTVSASALEATAKAVETTEYF